MAPIPKNVPKTSRPRRPGRRAPYAAADPRWPLIVIAGRPNVGKSTIFNRLVGARRSIVGDEPGITRDRIEGAVEWLGRWARIVDTGGILPGDKEFIPAEIVRQASVALEEASAIVLVVDGRTELAAPDMDLARRLLRLGKPLFLAINKIDAESLMPLAEDFRRLGLPRMLPVSAEHGVGMGELLDAVFAVLPAGGAAEDSRAGDAPDQVEEVEEPAVAAAPEIRVAIVGRPNVGKSTLLNALAGKSRAIVSPVAGTTRDAVDEVVEHGGERFRLIDTAGIRRKGKTREMAEKLSVVMARKHLESSDVALVLIDAAEGVTAADATIAGYAHESGRSTVIVVNKWDLASAKQADGKPAAIRRNFEQRVRRALKFLDYAPIVFLSATEGRNVHQAFTAASRVAQERNKRVGTGEMNRFLERVDFDRAPVPVSRRVRILYMTQAAVAPPTFVLFTDRQVKLHFSFERYLENRIRAAFAFEGTPIRFKVRARSGRSRK